MSDRPRRRTSTGAALELVATPSVAGVLPPHDLDAEAAMLSACMLDAADEPPSAENQTGRTSALSVVLDIVRGPQELYGEANGRIFQALQVMRQEGIPIDLVSVASWLRDRGWIQKIGGTAYLAQISDATPTVHRSHIEAHARKVHDKWRLRQLIATCQRVAAEGYGDVGEVQQFIDGAEKAIGEISQAGAVENLDRFHVGEIAKESAAESLELQSPYEGAFVATGIPSLDAVTGLYQNEVTLLGAPKGLGKSTLARWISDRVARTPRRLPDGRADCPNCGSEAPCCDAHARQPRGVLVFALEGTRRDWSDYLAARAANLNLMGRRNRTWTPDEHARFLRELEHLKRVPVAVDDRKDLCRANLGARVRAWREWFAKRGADMVMVVLDYFQIAAWERGSDSRENDLSDAGRYLIRLATDPESEVRGLAWLVISALNKDGNTRESQALEYHCDTFWRLSLGKGQVFNDDEKIIRNWIEKQRRGPSGIGASFTFDAARGRFW